MPNKPNVIELDRLLGFHGRRVNFERQLEQKSREAIRPPLPRQSDDDSGPSAA